MIIFPKKKKIASPECWGKKIVSWVIFCPYMNIKWLHPDLKEEYTTHSVCISYINCALTKLERSTCNFMTLFTFSQEKQ